jgi:hypothetical protein
MRTIFLVFGFWFLVFGFWFLVFDTAVVGTAFRRWRVTYFASPK